MSTFVALLRGINVGGHRRVKMADLRAALASLGATDVRTYVQSGNVVLTTDLDATAAVAGLVREAVAVSSGLTDVDVLVLTPEDLVATIEEVPFEDPDPKTVLVTFLDGPPSGEPDHPAPDSGDRFVIVGERVHVHCPGGFARTKLTHAFFEHKLGVRATGRSLRTVIALAAMVAEA